ncbi:MAG: DUF5715 family protein [Spirochaetes bacterium]|jgi:hypothetical protein|nr:DUF5715 family protein [Spirochaetota bacterium]
MKKSKLFVLAFCAGSVVAVAATVAVTRWVYEQKTELLKGSTLADVADFNRNSYGVERSVVENIPIYSDYATPLVEKSLRTYLYPFHSAVARKFGVSLDKQDQIEEAVDKGRLVAVDESSGYYFYGVKNEFRYLTPAALFALNLVVERFSTNMKKHGVDVPVKIAVSSLLRPKNYQQQLKLKNRNAVDESTHSYGVSFDIFFDDYYVVLVEGDRGYSGTIINEIRSRYGFMLGDSLHRQFKAVLAQTLLELQNEGQIYVIMEFRQRVFHVTFTELLHGNPDVQ